jgi:hypothetical protein
MTKGWTGSTRVPTHYERLAMPESSDHDSTGSDTTAGGQVNPYLISNPPTSPASSPSAGYYDDGSGQQRYWDGQQWSGAANAAVAGEVPTAADPPRARTDSESSSAATHAGWYQDATNPSQMRWWDGTAWTDDRYPSVAQPPGSIAPPVQGGQAASRNGFSGAALVLGLVSILGGVPFGLRWLPAGIGIFLALCTLVVAALAVLFGIMGVVRGTQVKRQTGRPLGRGPAIAGIVLGGVFLMGSATNAVAAIAPPAPATFTVSGTFKLVDEDANSETVCNGPEGYTDITDGAEVVVSDASGKTLGIGMLSNPSASGSDTCNFTFTVKNVPAGKKFYGIEVTHRGTVKETEAAMKAGPALELGDDG